MAARPAQMTYTVAVIDSRLKAVPAKVQTHIDH